MSKVAIYRIWSDSFHKINGIPVFFLPQSENISATNGRVAATFCMSGLEKKINLLPIQETSAYSEQMLWILASFKFFSPGILIGKLSNLLKNGIVQKASFGPNVKK